MTKLKPEFELAKRLKGPSQMDRVHAARAMLHSTMGSETMALRAFMDIFHPEEGEACIVAFHPDHPERLRIPQARPGHRRHALRHLLSP